MIENLPLVGAGCFGLLIGWYVYYINRHRKDDAQLSDLVTLIGVIGGATILSLFPAGTLLFGAYGIGLAIGFFGYFAMLLILVRNSDKFDIDYFLDGRKKDAEGKMMVPPLPAVSNPAAMDANPSNQPFQPK
jgi:hypothetical protein